MSSEFGFGPMRRQTRQHSWYSNISKRWFFFTFEPLFRCILKTAEILHVEWQWITISKRQASTKMLSRRCHPGLNECRSRLSFPHDVNWFVISISNLDVRSASLSCQISHSQRLEKNMESIRDVQRHLLWKSWVSRTDWCQEGLGLGKSWGSKINNQRVETPSKWFKVMTKKHGTLPSLFRSIAIGVLEKRTMSKMEESWHLFFGVGHSEKTRPGKECQAN